MFLRQPKTVQTKPATTSRTRAQQQLSTTRRKHRPTSERSGDGDGDARVEPVTLTKPTTLRRVTANRLKKHRPPRRSMPPPQTPATPLDMDEEESPQEVDRDVPSAHRELPTWEEAVSYLIQPRSDRSPQPGIQQWHAGQACSIEGRFVEIAEPSRPAPALNHRPSACRFPTSAWSNLSGF